VREDGARRSGMGVWSRKSGVRTCVWEVLRKICCFEWVVAAATAPQQPAPAAQYGFHNFEKRQVLRLPSRHPFLSFRILNFGFCRSIRQSNLGRPTAITLSFWEGEFLQVEKCAWHCCRGGRFDPKFRARTPRMMYVTTKRGPAHFYAGCLDERARWKSLVRKPAEDQTMAGWAAERAHWHQV
jgi:hypothetical protein